MNATVLVGLVAAGAVGAPCRYLVDALVQDRIGSRFPWGTLVINVSGSLLLGLLTGAAIYHGFPTTPKIVLGTGFCGAYTTFSTFTYETVRLLEEGDVGAAVRNTALSLVAGAGAAALGLAIAAH